MKNLTHFRFWCQKVLPLVYDDSISYYEVLCKMADYINGLIDNDKEIQEILVQYEGDINTLKAEIAELQAELEKIKNGEYMSEYIDALACWINNNLQCLVARIAKFVQFGLTDDGYFVAYIPSNWNFLQFDTIMDYSSNSYGHLVIEY